MENNFIPLNESQEEALGYMHYHLGFSDAENIALEYVENEFGKMHKHSIDLRKKLETKRVTLMNRCTKGIDNSGLQEVYIKRLKSKS